MFDIKFKIIPTKKPNKEKENEEETMMASKMSKSDPRTCIYMHETYDELKNKINSAYCPVKQEYGNPILDYCKSIIFKEVKSIVIDRPEKYGGKVEFKNYEELKEAYIKGDLHPADLKIAVTNELDKLIKPIRDYFEKNERAKKLYEKVKSLTITR